jgi:hypothetical protein
MLQTIYLTLCILGFVLPYSQFVPFLAEHGLDFKLFFEQLFTNRISSFFAMDILVSSIAFWIFVFYEDTRSQMKLLWVYVVSNLIIGLSFALPLFLLIRQRHLELVIVKETK